MLLLMKHQLFQRMKKSICELTGKEVSAVQIAADDLKHKCRECAHLRWIEIQEGGKQNEP